MKRGALAVWGQHGLVCAAFPDQMFEQLFKDEYGTCTKNTWERKDINTADTSDGPTQFQLLANSRCHFDLDFLFSTMVASRYPSAHLTLTRLTVTLCHGIRESSRP